MAIAITGGSGTGGASSLGGTYGTQVSIFTTPNVANTIYIISVSMVIANSAGNPSSGSALPNAGVTGPPGADDLVGATHITIKAGPNTAISVPITGSSSVGYKWSYHWVGITFS
jgi:hypothetical protein